MRIACLPVLLLLFCVEAAAGAAEGPGWLNVRECGASGSRFETTGTTTAGSNQVAVKDAGDFRAGQGVMVSRCNVRTYGHRLWGPGEPYAQSSADTGVEVRGYDGSAGSWIVYLMEIDGAGPTFRWSDDLARTWKAGKVPVTFEWQPLAGGTEVRFARRDWQPGHMVTFTARDQLVTTIEKVEGNVLTLKQPANRTAGDAVVRHCDSMAIQTAITRAIGEKRNVLFPAGHYRLAAGLQVRGAAGIRIEGESGADTVLDITNGEGACFALFGGGEVTLRNFRMVGHTGLADQPAAFRTSSGFTFWASTLKSCQGIAYYGTERVLAENVHASKMAAECFFSGGPYRKGKEEPAEYTRSATFLRCSVTDCAANAFNNCDFAENTNILYCRIDGAGWHAYEGSGRFIRFIGNYVRNAGPVTIGDIPHTLPRLDHLNDLGVGQAVVADNVFEGIGRSGGIAVNHCPTQVSITNNLFINYNASAIRASSGTVHNTYPPQNIVITGNVIDLTCADGKPAWRVGIAVSTSDTLVANNQVYVRGSMDPVATGIQLREGAVNVDVHDNLVRNCGMGLQAFRLPAKVTEVVDGAFLQAGLPLERRTSHLYRGWTLAWLKEGKPAGTSVVDAMDPATLRLKLTEPREVKAGDTFEAFPPSANWNLHDNTVTSCLRPVLLECYGGVASFLRGNVISRGEATGVKAAIEVRGRFTLLENQVSGFDEEGSVALQLHPDPLGRPGRRIFRGNTFERCRTPVAESEKGLWTAADAESNVVR